MIPKQKITVMICRKVLGLLLTGFFLTTGLTAQEYSKRIVRSFSVNNSTTVDIYNKYGKVHIVTWEKDSVMFNIDLRIKASSDSRLNKLKSKIDFDFTGTDYYIIAKTKIGNNSNNIIDDLADIAGSIMPGENRVTIDYLVMLPKHINLKIENKFGDIYIDDHNGNVNLTLSNGELKANELNGNSVISLSSGDGIVNFVKDGNLLISYSDFQIKSAENISIESRSSKINIEQAGFVKLKSRWDKFFIPEVSDLYGDSYWTEFNIFKLTHEMNFNFKYGSLNIDGIQRGFSFIQINSEYTDLDLIFERGSAYDIDITHHEDATLNYPRQLAKLQDKEIDAADKQVLTYGKIGAGTSGSKVKINAPKKCTINIIHK